MNKMKRKSIISVLLLGMVLGMFSTSCQDMLSPDSERHSYTVADDILYSYWGILKSLQNIAERYVILNECRGDLVDASSFVSDTIAAIVNFDFEEGNELSEDGACAYLKISDYYHVINSCNAYIAMCDTTYTTGTSEKLMLREYSQVLAIRAWVYMQLLYAYGENKVPFYTEPMLTTDDINNFVNDDSRPKVTAELLATELGPELEKMWPVEDKYGLPEYDNYGDVNSSNTHFVCHSSKCMFPVAIVLGDLYLLSGRYAEAASYYYKYINTDVCGPLSVNRCYSTGLIDDSRDYPIYNYDATNIPYTEKSKVSKSSESITCIPSNKGKLEGTVLTDINRLFGFEAQMRTSSSEGAGASVGLSRNYERELIPSKGYEALCDSQKFEIYLGNISGNTFVWDANSTTLEEIPGVGDARRAWIYNQGGEQWTFRVGDDNLYGKMVSKQNPRGSFSTTYPVIYRKSTVWLRFAEALNRAGYPSYAFAILKTGLCNNPMWIPYDPLSYGSLEGLTVQYFAEDGSVRSSLLDYKINDSLFVYMDETEEGDVVFMPEGWKEDEVKSTYASLEQYLVERFMQEDETLTEEDAKAKIEKRKVYWAVPSDDAISNQPEEDCGYACYYLDRREVSRAANVPFLNLNQPYLRGDLSQVIRFKEQGRMQIAQANSMSYPSGDTNYDLTYTIGVHQRGCGFICWDDPSAYRSSYTYVGMVQKKLKEEYEMELTEKQIYGDEGDYLEDVQNAVEDLIIDEMALELAFEGSRFSDLYRVAHRRQNPDYLAKRVAKRHTGEIDEKLRQKLQTEDSWFLPVPTE